MLNALINVNGTFTYSRFTKSCHIKPLPPHLPLLPPPKPLTRDSYMMKINTEHAEAPFRMDFSPFSSKLKRVLLL